MTNHISRAGWDARPPESMTPLDRSRVKYFIVHYSGANRSQFVRSIQDYCMDVKGHVDIDYNRIVRDDNDYMGRGWNVGGHTKDMNSVSYGVCVIGLDGDATDADKQTVREIYDEICASLGRQLIITDHQTLLGASYTDCPGSKLHTWVTAGMHYPEESDVQQTDALIKPTGNPRTVGDMYADVENLRNAFIGAGVAVPGSAPGEWPKEGSPLDNMARMPQLLAQHASAPIDPAALAMIMKPLFDAMETRLNAKIDTAIAALPPVIRQLVRKEIDDTKLSQIP